MLFMVGPSFLTKPILYSDRIPCGPSNLSIGIYIIAKKRQRIKFLCSLFPFVSLFLLYLQDYLQNKKQQPHSCCFFLLLLIPDQSLRTTACPAPHLEQCCAVPHCGYSRWIPPAFPQNIFPCYKSSVLADVCGSLRLRPCRCCSDGTHTVSFPDRPGSFLRPADGGSSECGD